MEVSPTSSTNWYIHFPYEHLIQDQLTENADYEFRLQRRTVPALRRPRRRRRSHRPHRQWLHKPHHPTTHPVQHGRSDLCDRGHGAYRGAATRKRCGAVDRVLHDTGESDAVCGAVVVGVE